MHRPERTACIGLGSNLGRPEQNIAEAVRRIDACDALTITHVSSRYLSAPLGGMDQPDYVNAVLAAETQAEPHDLLELIKTIERDMGRDERRERWAARVIDLDLLLLGDVVFTSDTLTIPHPGIAQRNFVLLPLQEICPDIEIPGLGRAMDLPVNHQEPRIRRCDDDKL